MRKLKLLLAALCLTGSVGIQSVYADELDITDLYITNPGFESGDTNGWTVTASDDTGARSTTNDTYSMSNSEGNFLFNIWWKGNPITQTIANLPAGSYTLSSVVASDGATIYMISGDNSDEYVYTETTDKTVGIKISKDFTLTETTNYKIGIVGGAGGEAGEHKPYEAEGYWWYKVDNFKLVLNLESGASIPAAIVQKLVDKKPTGKMSTSVEEELNTAVSTFQSSSTLDNYNSVLAAYAKAHTSIYNYAIITAGSVPTNKDFGWAISTTNGTLACNTWSNEGDTDGSDMTKPFIQDWVGKGTALGAGKLFYRMEGLNPGEKYSVSALVRVLDESGAAVSGATFYVNGETKDIAANSTSVTNGIAGTMNLAAEVDANGVLEIGIESASTSTFNWMSIKNVTIAEYAGVKVNSIELSKSSAAMTTGDALALTATVGPENADDKTITWSSSKDAVATVTAAGIIHAISPGTATITATANDGSNVKASCAITVEDAAAPAYWSEIAEGKFLIINAATGKYLGQGNNYGTHASIVDHGLLTTVTADGSNYKITGICNNSGFGDNGYVDNGNPAAFTATKQDDGTYTLSLNDKLVAVQAGTTMVEINGTDANSSLAQWYFISEETAKKFFDDATTSNPIDVTYFILDPNFSRNVDSSVWTMVSDNKNLSGGSDVNRCAESYQKEFKLSQEIIVPNGTYKMRAQAAANSDATGAVVYANDQETAFKVMANGENSMTNLSDQFSAGNYFTNWLTVTVTDNKLTVGVKGGNATSWCVWDNFELYMTNYVPTPAVNSVTLDKTSIELNASSNSATLTATVGPEGVSQTVVWTSSDENVATVKDGEVTGVAPGTATIRATAYGYDAIYAEATVTATYPEFETPTSDEVVSGPEKSVVNYGQNQIKNGAFSYGNGLYGWTDGQNPGKQLTADNFDIVTEDGNSYLRSKNHNGAGGAGSIGTAWPIENGKTYVFGYRTKAVNEGTTEFHKVSLTNELTNEQSIISTTQTVGTDWTDIKYKFTNSEGYTYLQFRARWLGTDGQLSSFDDFYLVEVTSESTTGNIQYLADNMPTTNIGTGAFQYNNTSEAQSLISAGSATVEQVQSAYEKMMTLNAPADGQLFNIVLANPKWTGGDGVDYENEAMTYIANGRNNQGNYNIQYKAEANKNLAQAFTFTKVEGNNYKLSQIDADGEVRYMCTAQAYGGSAPFIRTTTDADQAMLITVIPTSEEGVYNLRNVAANEFIGGQDAGVYTVNSHIKFKIVETSKPSITVISAGNYATLMVPFKVTTIPSGVTVYSCATLDGNKLELTQEITIEANKPYIIEGSLTEPLTGDAQGIALTYTNGLLTGVYAETAAPVGSYVLQNLDNVVGFYQVAEGSQPNVPANHAYLTASTSARSLYFDNATAIKAIEALTSGEAEFYNAAGTRQNKLQKGVNIIKQGNKTYKVMVK